MLVRVEASCARGCSAKDIVLAIIGKIGTAGGTGHAIEYAGTRHPRAQHGRPHDGVQHGDRGRRARRHDRASTRRPSPTCEGRPVRARRACMGAGRGLLAHPAPGCRRALRPRRRARCRRRSARRSPGARRPRWSSSIDDRVPDPEREQDPGKRGAIERALTYMALEPNSRSATSASTACSSAPAPTRASKTCARLPAWCAAPARSPPAYAAMVVPGSGLVKRQAESEGLDRIFRAAGFEWREPGCSMCLAMNDDRLAPGERCASPPTATSKAARATGGRTHLVSPAMAAAAAIDGPFRRRATAASSKETSAMQAIRHPRRAWSLPLDRGQRRHRPDHSQAVPEDDRAHGLRPRPVRRLALPDGDGRPRRTRTSC